MKNSKIAVVMEIFKRAGISFRPALARFHKLTGQSIDEFVFDCVEVSFRNAR